MCTFWISASSTLAAQSTSTDQPAAKAPQPGLTKPDITEEERKREEHKRIFGVLPNFNSVTIQNPAPLTPGHKLALATRTAIDPFTFVIAGFTSAIGQAQDSFPAYGQGAAGYGKRFGAAYADSFDGTIIGNGLLPIVFHQDPRYFRKGTGSFWSRTMYSVATAVRARSDSGHWMPNYSNLLGNVAAGGISNIYYPESDRGAGLTFQRAAVVTAQGVIGSVLVEFWPDIIKRHKRRQTNVTVP